MRKQHSDEYKKGYHDCACMLKGWILLNTDKETVLKYIQRAITRNEPKKEQEPQKEQELKVQLFTAKNNKVDNYYNVDAIIHKYGGNYIEFEALIPMGNNFIVSISGQQFGVSNEIMEILFKKDKYRVKANVDIIGNNVIVNKVYDLDT